MRLTACAVLLCAGLGAAHALAPSNLELVTGATRQAVQQALAELDVDTFSGDAAIVVHPAATHQANWLVEHLVTEELLNRGLTVAVDGAADASARLDLRVVDLSVDGKASLLGNSVQRRCRVVLRLELFRDGEQVASGDGHVEETDRIPENELDALQHSRFNFARTDLEKRSWGKYVEPVIVTTVLGSLVYLFFSNR